MSPWRDRPVLRGELMPLKHSLRFFLTVLVLAAAAVTAGALLARTGRPEAGSVSSVSSVSSASAAPAEEATGSALEEVTYSVTYEGTAYEKTAAVYVPAGAAADGPLDVLYLLHGSGGSGESLAAELRPLLDRWIGSGAMEPMLVVFPTYYPDASFVTADYTADYPLNRFFAETEIDVLIPAVESRYPTWAEDVSAAGIAASRDHRAFGGYSMGGVTAWEMLAVKAPYFSWFLPMAGDCWLGRTEEAQNGAGVSDLLMRSIRENGYTSSDFHILAMVGGNDSTRFAMQTQIAALRADEPDLITEENLQYWENEGGGHSAASLEAELEHAAPLLFAGS